jgi:general secretion pathway protein M
MISDQQAGKMAMLRPDDSLARIIEEIGIKGKGVKITPLKGEERNGVIEETADVRIEGLTANEMVNLVYRLEKGSRPISLKKANLRVRFDDPSRFDLAMTAALLKPAPGKSR